MMVVDGELLVLLELVLLMVVSFSVELSPSPPVELVELVELFISSLVFSSSTFTVTAELTITGGRFRVVAVEEDN